MKHIIEIPVDIYNEFCYNNRMFRINPNLKQYHVRNYPIRTNGKYNHWTNDCDMDSIIVINNGYKLKFLDQNGTDITSDIEWIN